MLLKVKQARGMEAGACRMYPSAEFCSMLLCTWSSSLTWWVPHVYCFYCVQMITWEPLYQYLAPVEWEQNDIAQFGCLLFRVLIFVHSLSH